MNYETLLQDRDFNYAPNPWQHDFLQNDQQISGKVISIRNNIVHVKIRDYDQLVGRGRYPLTFDASRGDEVCCRIKGIDREKKEIMLIIQYKRVS